MGDEHTWRKVLHIIERYEHPVVIVSATARTTRRLIAAAELAVSDYRQALSIAGEIKERHRLLVENFMAQYAKVAVQPTATKCEQWMEKCTATLQKHLNKISETGRLNPETKDAVASIGEQLSSRLFAWCGFVLGLETTWVDACDIIKTDSDFGNANPDLARIQKSTKHILHEIKQRKIPVMGGYYGEDTQGNITTLGFEGSDFSASLIGSALGAEAIEIWTDVSGIYTCDPRVIEAACPIKELSFREATEMAYFGAKVLHPSTMNPAEEKQIPIFVKNIFDPDHPGTKIQGEVPAEGLAKAMTFLNDVAIITAVSPHTRMGYEFLSAVFNVLKEYHLPVNVVTTTEASVSVALKQERIDDNVLNALKDFGEVEKRGNQGSISLIGCNFEKTELIGDVVLSALAGQEVAMISYSQAKQNMNIVLSEEELIPSVKAIHKKLFQ